MANLVCTKTLGLRERRYGTVATIATRILDWRKPMPSCHNCGATLLLYTNWVRRDGERRKLRFYGCICCPANQDGWEPLDEVDREFWLRPPLRVRAKAAIAETERILLDAIR